MRSVLCHPVACHFEKKWRVRRAYLDDVKIELSEATHLAHDERRRSPAAGSRSEARAEQLSWLSRGLVCFLTLDRLGLPGCPMLQHSIEYGQKLMHTGCQGDFFHLAHG